MRASGGASPDRRVFCIVGDGSAMYTIQSFWTAAHDSIPVVWIIFKADLVSLSKLPVNGPIGQEWWRVFTTQFTFISGLYMFGALAAVGVFGWLLERRYGPAVVIALFLACGGAGAALEVAAQRVQRGQVDLHGCNEDQRLRDYRQRVARVERARDLFVRRLTPKSRRPRRDGGPSGAHRRGGRRGARRPGRQGSRP